MMLLKLLIIIPCTAFLLRCSGKNEPTDYEIELAQINDAILKTESSLVQASADEQITELVHLLYLRASLTGNYDHYKITETTINSAIQDYGPSQDLYYFRALLNFKLHRIQNTKSDLEMLQDLANTVQIRALKADIALQEGRYAEAKAGYEGIISHNRTWDNLARAAYLKSKTGNPMGAEKLYEEALAEITAKEMRSYAWVELQRGLLDLDHRRYEEALSHYRQATKAYSGYWLIEEHIAEVLDLLGQTSQAIELYKEIIEKTENPEFVSALANVIEKEDHESAVSFHKQADRLYAQQFNLYPEAVIGHLIQHLLERNNTGNRRKLLEFAKRNYQLRPNSESKFLLAKSYLKLNKVLQARKLMEEILETPWRTPELSKILNEISNG